MVTDIERAIEQAEAIVCSVFDDAPDEGLDPFDFARETVRALTEAGLLAPGALTEEWGADCYLGSEPEAYSERRNAEKQLAYEGGSLLRRYVSDWMPVDRAEGDGRTDQ